MSKHTPEPWMVYGRHVVSSPTDMSLPDISICTVDWKGGTEEELANGRLLAAAPKLLSTLISLLECGELNMDDLDPKTCQAIQKAHELITHLT